MQPPDTTLIWAYRHCMHIRKFTESICKQAAQWTGTLTVCRALKLHMELADVVIYKLHLPIAHHAANRHTAKDPKRDPVKTAHHKHVCAHQMPRISCAYSFITSCSLRLLGLAMADIAKFP
jgi:dethiobiotin synthetase